MDRFETKFRGYDTVQVNKFIDDTISKYEELLNRLKQSDEEIVKVKQELEHYKEIEDTLKRAIFSAEDKCDQMKHLAREESEMLINDAKKNANRIVNDALLKADKAQEDTIRLKRNINYFKRRLKRIIEGQLEIVDEIEEIDLRSNDGDGIY